MCAAFMKYVFLCCILCSRDIICMLCSCCYAVFMTWHVVVFLRHDIHVLRCVHDTGCVLLTTWPMPVCCVHDVHVVLLAVFTTWGTRCYAVLTCHLLLCCVYVIHVVTLCSRHDIMLLSCVYVIHVVTLCSWHDICSWAVFMSHTLLRCVHDMTCVLVSDQRDAARWEAELHPSHRPCRARWKVGHIVPLPVCLSHCSSVRLSITLSLCPSITLSPWPSITLSLYPSVYHIIPLSVCLS